MMHNAQGILHSTGLWWLDAMSHSTVMQLPACATFCKHPAETTDSEHNTAHTQGAYRIT
jgi:hypothetical protein